MNEGEPRQSYGGWEEDLEAQFPSQPPEEMQTSWVYNAATGQWVEVWQV